MLRLVGIVALLAMNVGVLTVIASRSKLTRPLRTWLVTRRWGAWPSAVLRCTFCTSVWIAAGVVLLARDHGSSWPAACAVWLALVALAAPVVWVVERSHSGH